MTPVTRDLIALSVGLLAGWYLRFLRALWRFNRYLKRVEAAPEKPVSDRHELFDYRTCFLCFMPLDLEDDKSYILFKGKMACSDRQGCRARRHVTDREAEPTLGGEEV